VLRLREQFLRCTGRRLRRGGVGDEQVAERDRCALADEPPDGTRTSTGYDDATLDGFAERARNWVGEGRDAYIFMINGAKVRAPAAALALQERLR